MATTIEDGTGSGYALAINRRGRLLAAATTEERAVFNSANDGQTYMILTDYLTVTGVTSQEDGILYIKNTSDLKMYIHHIKVWCGTSGQFTKIKVYRNPTTGTLITSTIDADITNMNYGSANAFEGLAYQGDGTNLTVTNGSVMGRHYLGVGMQQSLMQMFMGSVVLEKGSSIAITAEAPNGVTVNITCEIMVYFE